MKKVQAAFCVISLLLSSELVAAVRFPKDVNAFIARRDACEHFRGEFPDPPDEEREKEVNDAIKQYCTGTDTALAKLKKRYRRRLDIMKKLNEYEAEIE